MEGSSGAGQFGGVRLGCASARSARDCSRIGNRLFKADDNIRRYETLLVFDTIKSGLALPLPAPQTT
jgi:Lrp/AsnC family leucine-responsive transcriptional regulator